MNIPLPAIALQPAAEIRFSVAPDKASTQTLIAEAEKLNTSTQSADLPQSYPYLSISAGMGFPENLKGSFTPGPTIGTIGSQFPLNSGFSGELAAGYKFPDVRAEVAVGYGNFQANSQSLTIRSLNISTSPTGSGTTAYTSILINGYYDFPVRQSNGNYSRLRPYLGAGIGYASVAVPGCFGSNCFQGGSAGTFAYQAKVGLSYRAISSGDLFLEGAFLGTNSFTVNSLQYENFGAFRVALGWRQRL